jgi:hypothetical protein
LHGQRHRCAAYDVQDASSRVIGDLRSRRTAGGSSVWGISAVGRAEGALIDVCFIGSRLWKVLMF